MIQTVALLTQAQMPANLTPQGPPDSELGPQFGLDDSTDGSVGNSSAVFQSVGMPYPVPVPQIVEVAEGIVDYGTVAAAERSMSGEEAVNRPSNEPTYDNGVERVVATPALGDDTLMFQIDDGAPHKAGPYNGPYVGRVETTIQVRNGDVIFAVRIVSDPDTGMASLAVSVMRAVIAREHAVCG